MKNIRIFALTCALGLTGWVGSAQQRGEGQFFHTIERGQTVYAIATMYGVSVDEIYQLNPGSKEGIKAGATLRIPQRSASEAASTKASDPYTYHTIQGKETLYALSIRYQVPATEIVAANPGLSASTFQKGKTIRIPQARDAAQASTQQTKATAPGSKTIAYTVERKETLYRICRKFGVSSTELISLNPELRNGVRAGMVIQVPATSGSSGEAGAAPTAQAAPSEHEVNALLNAPKRIDQIHRIRMALLLPFQADQQPQSAASARFVEYYEGLLLAVDSIRKLGHSVELSVYDTGSGTEKVKQYLKDDALANANLIIGAVQNDQIALIADFAQKHQIKYVIPFTSKNDDVLSNAQVYQVNTPHSYLYSKAAVAGCDLFKNDNIVLVNIPDKEVKTDFIKAFKSEMQEQKIAYKEMNYDGQTFATDIEALLLPDKRNIVLPTSASLDAINKIKGPLRMLTELAEEDKIPYQISLFGYPEWQTYSRECLEDFYALNTYIYSNFYADNLSHEVHQFYHNFKNWYSKSLINTFPKYGILGFDTGMFFLNALSRYGSNFENNLDKIHYQSIQTGFDFNRVNNWGGFINTNLFIVHFQSDFTVTRTKVN